MSKASLAFTGGQLVEVWQPSMSTSYIHGFQLNNENQIVSVRPVKVGSFVLIIKFNNNVTQHDYLVLVDDEIVLVPSVYLRLIQNTIT